MELHILGYTAQKKRTIKPGKEFDALFPPALGTTQVVSRNADLAKTLDTLPAVVAKYAHQTKKIAAYLNSKSPNKQALAKNIFDFYYAHVDYANDKTGVEQLKQPARLWADRKGDCDCFTVSVSGILNSLNIPHYAKIVKIGGTSYQHIYIIVPKDPANFNPERDKDNPSTYYAIDPVVDEALTEPKGITESMLLNLNVSQNLGKIFHDEEYLRFGKEMEGLGKYAATLGSTCAPNVACEAVTHDVLERIKMHIINTKNRLNEKSFDGKEWAMQTLESLAQNIHDPIARQSIINDLKKEQSPELGNAFRRGWDWTKGVVQRFVDAIEAAIAKIKEIAKKGATWVVNVAQAVLDEILRFNPVSWIIRTVILKAIRNNSGRMSEKMRWAFATDLQLRIAGLPTNARTEARARFDKVNALWNKVYNKSAWGAQKTAQEHSEELIDAILTAAPLPEEVLSGQQYQVAVKNTNFILDTQNYQFFELTAEPKMAALFTSLQSSLGAGKTIEQYAQGKNTGMGSTLKSYFAAFVRNDGYHLVFWIDQARQAAIYYKTYTAPQARDSGKFGGEIVASGAGGVPLNGIREYWATTQDAQNVATIITNADNLWLIKMYGTNLELYAGKDISLARIEADTVARGYLENVLLKDLQDKQFFVVPRNNSNEYVIYRLNLKPDDFGTYDPYAPSARDWNYNQIVTTDQNNADLISQNTPRIEFFKVILASEYAALRSQNTISTLPYGTWRYIASAGDIFTLLAARFAKITKTLPGGGSTVLPPGGGGGTTTTNTTTSNTGTFTSNGGGLITSGGGGIVTSGGGPNDIIVTLGQMTRKKKPYRHQPLRGYKGRNSDMYIPTQLSGCGCQEGLGIVDPVTAGAIVKVAGGVLKNMFDKCKEQDPSFNVEIKPEQVIQVAGVQMERLDQMLTKDPTLADKFNQQNPGADTSSQFPSPNPDDYPPIDPNAIQGQYKTEQDIANKASEIENKHGVNINDMVSYLPQLLDNQQNPYDTMTEADKTNAGYEGISWIAKIFTWLRDMWHKVFPPHTWLGKYASFMASTIAKSVDWIWKETKSLFSCKPNISEVPDAPESDNTALYVGVAAVAAAGIFLIKPVKNPIKGSGLKGIEPEPDLTPSPSPGGEGDKAPSLGKVTQKPTTKNQKPKTDNRKPTSPKPTNKTKTTKYEV